MKKIIESKRLILRELDISDSEDFYNLNSDPEVLKYTGDRAFSSVSEAESFLRNYNDYKKNGFGRWAVISKGSNDFIGWCGLKLNEEKLIDLGFRFFKNQWGKGYATESARASLEYGFNNLKINEVIGRASIDNKASIVVLEKLKMKFWKNDSCEGIENSVYYRINKTQYNN
ncbi:MAG: GNAT family N-acetyltransferase [Flavobacteriales bacterium]|jgi:RimJ/RimL family protein N-acetyltransferase|nr:GNAT family N-acetyltransferase [Flavobacteriales bacterium]